MAGQSRGARRRLLVAGAVGLAIVMAGAVALSGGGGGDATATATASQAAATTTVRRQDLVETETVAGTLGYSDARTVVSRLSGTVTRTPKVGSVVRTDRPLCEVDGTPVYLLDGAYPAYRALQAGLTGDDVRQLERNLRRLGLDGGRGMRVDGAWDPGTTAAVKRWQLRKGLPQDGVIEQGRIVFQPGSRRVAEVTRPAGSSASGAAGLGAAPGGGAPSAPDVAAPLMTTTSTRRVVGVDLEAAKQELAREGARVTVEMPGGVDVSGTIARVGKVAQKKVTPQNEDPPATIKVVIKLRRSTGTGLDQAPVDVLFERRRAKDVLVVPVTALLARVGGEFAVEVRDGDRRRVVPVETGLYTDGYVEVEGAGLRPGLKVTDADV